MRIYPCIISVGAVYVRVRANTAMPLLFVFSLGTSTLVDFVLHPPPSCVAGKYWLCSTRANIWAFLIGSFVAPSTNLTLIKWVTVLGLGSVSHGTDRAISGLLPIASSQKPAATNIDNMISLCFLISFCFRLNYIINNHWQLTTNDHKSQIDFVIGAWGYPYRLQCFVSNTQNIYCSQASGRCFVFHSSPYPKLHTHKAKHPQPIRQ